MCPLLFSVLKLEDTVRSHRFYFIAAKNAIEVSVCVCVCVCDTIPVTSHTL